MHVWRMFKEDIFWRAYGPRILLILLKTVCQANTENTHGSAGRAFLLFFVFLLESRSEHVFPGSVYMTWTVCLQWEERTVALEPRPQKEVRLGNRAAAAMGRRPGDKERPRKILNSISHLEENLKADHFQFDWIFFLF